MYYYERKEPIEELSSKDLYIIHINHEGTHYVAHPTDILEYIKENYKGITITFEQAWTLLKVMYDVAGAEGNYVYYDKDYYIEKIVDQYIGEGLYEDIVGAYEGKCEDM